MEIELANSMYDRVSLRIGRYSIAEAYSKDKEFVWIQCDDGEAMDTEISRLTKCLNAALKQYFKENM